MKFSVVTPVYNREDCVSRCIESVINQMLKNVIGGGKIELLIVDDGSTDLTAEICAGYAKNNPEIRFIKFKENRGTNAARNAAIHAATGDWIVMLDSDDYFVEDAIEYMESVIKLHPQYRHYMFAPDDVSYENSFFNNCRQKELHYEDFLHGSVNTGFIHCIAAETMKKHPFDETVRIHEGVFFLSFYKEAQQMLFTNRVVTIRERGRSDSVTLEAVRTNRKLIERGVQANEIMLELFGEDMKQQNCKKQLSHLYTYLYDNYLLLSKYDKIESLENEFKIKYQDSVPVNNKIKLLSVVKNIQGGKLYYFLLQAYLFAKYKLFKHKTK